MGRHHKAQFFDEFAPHTKLKHAILQDYLATWVHKVGLGRPSSQQLVLVDAFAGEGGDKAGNSGSPLRMLRVAASSEGRLTLLRGSQIETQVILIEHSRGRRARLEERVAAFGDRVRVLGDTLDKHLDSILDEFPSAPMLFFLDPFGVKGLEGSLIKRALSSEAREVFILVDDDGIHRLLRTAMRGQSRQSIQLRAEALALDLFEPDRQLRLTAKADHSQASLEITAEHSARHLTRYYASDAWRALAALNDADELRHAAVALFEHNLQHWGAPYTTRIPIRNADGQPAYVLLHASSHRRGRLAMKESIDRCLRQSDLSAPVQAQIREELSCDPREIAKEVCSAYAGRDAPWPHKQQSSIRDFVLEETAAFPWALDSIEGELSGFRLPGRAKRYRFPPKANSLG